MPVILAYSIRFSISNPNPPVGNAPFYISLWNSKIFITKKLIRISQKININNLSPIICRRNHVVKKKWYWTFQKISKNSLIIN